QKQKQKKLKFVMYNKYMFNNINNMLFEFNSCLGTFTESSNPADWYLHPHDTKKVLCFKCFDRFRKINPACPAIQCVHVLNNGETNNNKECAGNGITNLTNQFEKSFNIHDYGRQDLSSISPSIPMPFPQSIHNPFSQLTHNPPYQSTDNPFSPVT